MRPDLQAPGSLPGAGALDAALKPDAPVLIPMRGGGAPEPRVTLSARVLNGALAKHLVITGQKKRAALERVRGLPATDAPVAAVLADMSVHWAE